MALALQTGAAGSPAWVVGGIVVGFLLFIVLVLFLTQLNLWVRCVTTGAGIGFFDLVGMTLRKVPPRVIVEAKIMLLKAGVPVETGRLEAHYLAGGHVPQVVKALIAAHLEGLDLTFDQVAALDLRGHDVPKALEALTAAKQSGGVLNIEQEIGRVMSDGGTSLATSGGGEGAR
jgi:uncharacterized protein YqfA (UPF0365 family)